MDSLLNPFEIKVSSLSHEKRLVVVCGPTSLLFVGDICKPKKEAVPIQSLEL